MFRSVFHPYNSYKHVCYCILHQKMLSEATDCPIAFYTPFNMVVSGPSQVGKTTFIKNLLERTSELPGSIVPKPTRIKYVYGEEAPKLDVRVEFHRGWSSTLMDDMLPTSTNVIVLDDVANECRDDASLSNMFTRGGHHRNISIILLTQNYFFAGRTALDVRRNTHYLVLFACKQDKKQVSTFAQRLFPFKWKNFMQAYEDATRPQHGHLLVDMTTRCDEKYMVRARSLSDRPVLYLI